MMAGRFGSSTKQIKCTSNGSSCSSGISSGISSSNIILSLMCIIHSCNSIFVVIVGTSLIIVVRTFAVITIVASVS